MTQSKTVSLSRHQPYTQTTMEYKAKSLSAQRKK